MSQDRLDYLYWRLSQSKAGRLYSTGRRPVAGTGDPEADLMLVGEAPGEREDLRKLPFIGPSGELLDRIFTRLGVSREDLYITNVVKKQPPRNRNPDEEEVDSPSPFSGLSSPSCGRRWS